MCEKEPNFDSNIFVLGRRKAGVHDPCSAKGGVRENQREREAGRGGVPSRSCGSCRLRENESKSSRAVRQLRRTAPRHSRVTTAKSSNAPRKTGMKNGSCLSTRARPRKTGPVWASEVEEPSGACSVRVGACVAVSGRSAAGCLSAEESMLSELLRGPHEPIF
ncbi:unnamed protein product [Pleuronectes platessa]|uniref:Uncharacterized protein n=1 Tax=Pleuronectes platessa TaxID=8262 RepID=A0A9N7Y4D3_PLEPL|nr:unnamed protein product [Pleuronectes platessa]